MRPFKIVLVLFFCGFLPFGCCNEPREFILNIRDLQVEPLPPNAAFPVSDSVFTVDSDTLRLHTYLNVEQVFLTGTGFSPVSRAYATSCPNDIPLGLSSKVDSVVITADKDFRGIPAGKSLNSQCIPVAISDTLGSPDNTFEQLRNNLNGAGQYSYSFALYFIKAPGDSSLQRYTVRLHTHDGKVYSKASKPISWK
jgi:hypothetical protein